MVLIALGNGLTTVFGPYANRLNGFGPIRLRSEQDAVMIEVNYGNKTPWPAASDGTGHSLVLKRPSYGENDARAWGASANLGGSPGAFDSASIGPLDGVRINELVAGGIDSFIELYNHRADVVDLSGCTLGDQTSTSRFAIPPGSILAGGQFISFDRATLGFGPGAGGGKVILCEPSGWVLDAVTYGPQEAYSWTPTGSWLTATTNRVRMTDLPLGTRSRFYRARRSP